MANYVYHRCSTDHQDFAQQQKCVKDYLLRMGIDPASIVATVVEKISGAVKYEERKLSDLIKQCNKGDIIYVSELSRLGRNMANLFQLVNLCSERDITLIQCKDGTPIENKSIGGKALLFALSLAAEIELANINQRTQMGMNVVKEKLRKGERHISRTGREVTHLGNVKGCDTSKAREASIISKRAEAQKRRENSIAYMWVTRKLAAGWPRDKIIEEFNELHSLSPENAKIYCTFGGGPLTKGILSKWANEINKSFLDFVEIRHNENKAKQTDHTSDCDSAGDEH